MASAALRGDGARAPVTSLSASGAPNPTPLAAVTHDFGTSYAKSKLSGFAFSLHCRHAGRTPTAGSIHFSESDLYVCCTYKSPVSETYCAGDQVGCVPVRRLAPWQARGTNPSLVALRRVTSRT